MATTFTATTTAQAQPWRILIYIEGFGSGDTPYVLCNEVPAYASTTYYLPYLTDLPDILSETLPAIGGVASRGSFSFQVADVGALLSSTWRIMAPPFTSLTADQTSTSDAVNFTVPDATLFTADAYYFVGAECFKVTSRSGTTLGVARSKRGTTTSPRYLGDNIYSYIPYIVGRKVTVKLVPHDASSSAQEQLVGSYSIVDLVISDDARVWNFEAGTELGQLARLIATKPIGQLQALVKDDNIEGWQWTAGEQGTAQWANEWASSISGYFISDGTSVAQVQLTTFNAPTNARNGVCGTAKLTATDAIQVMCADKRFNSSFRWSPGSAFGGTAATSRASGTWNQTAHWIDILLCILTSPSSSTDGIDISTNYSSTYGNWACLPTGLGLGVPASKIDFASFMDARQRTFGFDFPGFFFGHESVSFSELATSNFLEVVGATIYQEYSTGKIAVTLPRAGDTTKTAAFALTTANILNRPYPVVKIKESTLSVTLNISNGLGGTRPISVSNALSGARLTGRSGFVSSAIDISVDAKGLVDEFPGSEMLAVQCAARIMTQMIAGAYKIRLRTTLDVWGIGIGDVGTLTCPLIPNMVTGALGVTNMLVMVTEVGLLLEPVCYELTLVSFAGATPGIHGYSAYVTSGAVASGNATLTISTANVFSDPYGQDGLPTNDATAWVVGDKLDILGTDGISLTTGGNYATVASTSSSTIVCTGDFGGLAAGTMAGKYVVPAPFSAASTAQKAKHVFLADAGDNTISGTQTAFAYGDI